MKKEDIEKEAMLRFNIGEPTCGIEKFIEGANWRINSVFHDVSEIPLPESRIFYEDTKGQVDVMLFCDGEQWDGFDDYGFEIVRWAYIEDLLPTKEK